MVCDVHVAGVTRPFLPSLTHAHKRKGLGTRLGYTLKCVKRVESEKGRTRLPITLPLLRETKGGVGEISWES